MLEKEPLSFPSRNRYVYDPGVSNRQMWAIGMIVVQWSMLEWFIDMSTHRLMSDDQALMAEYKNLRNFKQSLAFWKTLLELKTAEPFRSHAIAVVPRIQNLSAQRDEVIHRLWAGGAEEDSWGGAGLATTDAGLMPNPGEKVANGPREGLIPFTWKATFVRLRKLATDIAGLNRDVLQLTILPSSPHGYVDSGGQVSP